MEQLLKSAEPAITCACDRLIELVDRVVNRDYRTLGPKNHAAYTPSARSRAYIDYDAAARAEPHDNPIPLNSAVCVQIFALSPCERHLASLAFDSAKINAAQ